jgi:MFS transporter, DHA1 family, inner membrane transport protein
MWLSIGAICLLSAGSFAVYSYFARYLEVVFRLDGPQIGNMLLLFGLAGIAGNYVAGLALSRSLVKTMFIYLPSLAMVFCLLYLTKGHLPWQAAVIAFWGLLHGAGFVIAQVWITAPAWEAPELASSLTISFSNLGIAAGAALGGLVIDKFGIKQVVWAAWGLLSLSFLLVIIQHLATKKIPARKPEKSFSDKKYSCG